MTSPIASEHGIAGEAAAGGPPPRGAASRALGAFVAAWSRDAGASPEAVMTAEAQAALTALVDVDAFVFVGLDQQPQSWADLLQAMAARDHEGGLTCEAERIEQAGDLAFVQLRERRGPADAASERTTMTVLAFGPTGLLRRVDTFG